MIKSFTGLVRLIAGIGFAILVMFILSSFAPNLFWGLVGIIGMVLGYSAPLVFILLFTRSWKLSKTIRMHGFKLRAKFMVLRAFQEVFRGSYQRMVRGDSDTKPELTKAQRLRLLHHDNGLTDEQLKDSLAALSPAKRRNSDDTTEAEHPVRRQQVVREEPVETDRTAPRANRLAQQQSRTPQRPTTPVEEKHHDVPVEEDTRPVEVVEESAPAARPARPAPQPRRTPRPNGSDLNNTSGFSGSINLTGDWAKNKD